MGATAVVGVKWGSQAGLDWAQTTGAGGQPPGSPQESASPAWVPT